MLFCNHKFSASWTETWGSCQKNPTKKQTCSSRPNDMQKKKKKKNKQHAHWQQTETKWPWPGNKPVEPDPINKKRTNKGSALFTLSIPHANLSHHPSSINKSKQFAKMPWLFLFLKPVSKSESIPVSARCNLKRVSLPGMNSKSPCCVIISYQRASY